MHQLQQRPLKRRSPPPTPPPPDRTPPPPPRNRPRAASNRPRTRANRATIDPRPRAAANSSCGTRNASASPNRPALTNASAYKSCHGQNPGSSTPARSTNPTTGSNARNTPS